MQVVRWLLNARVRINLKNLENCTALDILERRVQVKNNEMIQMDDMLCGAGALKASSHPAVNSKEAFLKSHGPNDSTYNKLNISIFREQKNMTNDKRNMLLVVVVLFITATYQAALSPPGGVWQDNYNPPTDQFNTTSPINVTSELSPTPPTIPINVTRELSPTPHKAGKVTMNKINFGVLIVTNTFCFILSIVSIKFLLPSDTITRLCFAPMIFLYLSYVISLSIISPFAKISWKFK
jgi:hypothetical protein